MQNLPFVLWLLLYPVVISVTRYLRAIRIQHTREKWPSLNVLAFTELTELVIWYFVARALYVPVPFA